MKYIDSEKLIAEINGIIAAVKAKEHPDELGSIGQCLAAAEIEALNLALDCIKELQQEQQEVELDFQVFAKEMDAVFNLPKEVTENTEENPLNWEYAIARHFAEWGSIHLNARKEE